MICIVPYEEKYDEAVRQIDPRKFHEMKTHGDVLRDRVYAALEGSSCVGFGYLMVDEDFRRPAEDCKEGHVNLEYQVMTGSDSREVSGSLHLLEVLLDDFDDLSATCQEKKLILRTFCNAQKTAYMEFLLSFGFRAARPLLVLSKSLFHGDPGIEDCRSTVICRPLENYVKNEEEIIEIKEIKLEDPAKQLTYLKACERAFHVPESVENLRYRLRDPQTRVFAAVSGDRILGGMLTWNTGRSGTGVASTEFIFCDPAYRRKGIAEAMLRYALRALGKSGMEKAILTVYGTNLPACSLYLKLGYELRSVLIEMQYTTDMRE